MKKLIFLFIISSFGFLSCENNDETNKTSNNDTIFKRDGIRFHVIFADWSEWGRTSRDCDGWGLCNFRSCTFCCTDSNGVIVSCNENQNRISRSGKIVLYEDNEEGFLEINLDVVFPDEKNAIDNKLILYIDQDLVNDGVKLHKGEYEFNLNVGRYGGYIIKASKV
ncbi:hypothetical protein [Flavobacterium sp.]|uniref:hypothetical protein n=1 Tax=Flavobacterium sp. TaxID=239 RepID=UPI0035279F51